MRNYGKISPRFWIGETGKKIRGDHESQVLALYLMSSPHSNMIGIYHCPVMYMAYETGMSHEGASKALKSLIEAGFCDYDEASETVFVVRMANYQIGESLKPGDKRVEGLKRDLEKIHPDRFRYRFLEIYGEAFSLADHSSKTSPLEGSSKGLRSQEQEQEQEQEQDISATSEISLGAEDEKKIDSVVQIPLNDNSERAITEAEYAEMVSLYPAIDVLSELRKARGWCLGNKSRRKTRAGVMRFLHGWLGKAQDRSSGLARASPQFRQSPAEPKSRSKHTILA
jgi:hypothetical protein